MTFWFYWSEAEGGKESAYPLRFIGYRRGRMIDEERVKANEVMKSTRRMVTRRNMMSHEVMHCAPLALDLLQTAC